MHYKLMTYNIRKGKGIKRSKPALQDIVTHIKIEQPDFLLCQEVAQYHELPKQVQQDEVFSQHLNMQHCYEPNVKKEHRNHGNATFSKHPIICHTNFDVSTNRLEDRGILLSEMQTPSGSLFLCNVHFGLTPLQRRKQTKALESLVLEHVPDNAPVIMAGDFNDVSGWVDRYVQGRDHFQNALDSLSNRQRRSWSSRKPLLSLDRIYYRNIKVEEVKVLSGHPWYDLSDHLPIVMTFSMTKKEN